MCTLPRLAFHFIFLYLVCQETPRATVFWRLITPPSLPPGALRRGRLRIFKERLPIRIVRASSAIGTIRIFLLFPRRCRCGTCVARRGVNPFAIFSPRLRERDRGVRGRGLPSPSGLGQGVRGRGLPSPSGEGRGVRAFCSPPSAFRLPPSAFAPAPRSRLPKGGGSSISRDKRLSINEFRKNLPTASTITNGLLWPPSIWQRVLLNRKVTYIIRRKSNFLPPPTFAKINAKTMFIGLYMVDTKFVSDIIMVYSV